VQGLARRHRAWPLLAILHGTSGCKKLNASAYVFWALASIAAASGPAKGAAAKTARDGGAVCTSRILRAVASRLFWTSFSGVVDEVSSAPTMPRGKISGQSVFLSRSPSVRTRSRVGAALIRGLGRKWAGFNPSFGQSRSVAKLKCDRKAVRPGTHGTPSPAGRTKKLQSLGRVRRIG